MNSLPSLSLLTLGVAFALFCTTATANAQESVTLDQYRAAATADDAFVINRPNDQGDGRLSVHLHLDYALNPLVFERFQGDAGTERVQVVHHQLVTQLGFAYGLANRFVLFAGLPVNLVMSGTPEPGQPDADGTSLGDFRLGARYRILGEAQDHFALGAQLTVYTPTASLVNSGQSFAGESTFSARPELLLELRGEKMRFTFNLGLQVRRLANFASFEVGPEFTWGIGYAQSIVRDVFALHVQLYGATSLSQFGDREGTPIEATVGFRADVGNGWSVGLAGGPGIQRGYGSPDFRGALTFGWSQPEEETEVVVEEPGDRDRDGILDATDQCPDNPEDLDRIQDTDGCPELDADSDSVLDPNDHCPLTPGIHNVGNPECDGCPALACTDDSGNIRILERIEFETDRDVIMNESIPVLEDVAAILSTNLQITQMRIEGHTDDRAPEDYNLDLSSRRAAAVKRWLVARGIEGARLATQGFGEGRPLVPNTSPENWHTNRRVEFHIIRIGNSWSSTVVRDTVTPAP